MIGKRYISKESLQQLALAGGIRSVSKNSINRLSDIFLNILWSIIEHGRRVTEKRKRSKNMTVNDVIRGLGVFQEPIKKSETLLQNIKRCESFTMKRSRYLTYENYSLKKLEFYKTLKKCSLLTQKSYDELIDMIIQKTGFSYSLPSDTRIVIKKVTEKVFKRFMQGLGEDLEEQGRKILKTEVLEEVWSIFQTTREIIPIHIELEGEWYYRTKDENGVKKDDLVNQFMMGEEKDIDSIIEEIDRPLDQVSEKNVNDILWPMIEGPEESESGEKEQEETEEPESEEKEQEEDILWPMTEGTEENEQTVEPISDISTEIDLNTLNISDESEIDTDSMDQDDILNDAEKVFKEEIDKLFDEESEESSKKESEIESDSDDLVETNVDNWDITIEEDDELRKELSEY